jgi:DNA-directed RNA polymerase subunit beta'
MEGKLADTTVGRVLVARIVDPQIPFEILNQVMAKKALGELIDQAYRRLATRPR